MSLTHSDLTDLAIALGYKSITKAGLCHGFSMMLTQAFLAQDQKTFFDRLKLIESYEGNYSQLKEDIDKIKDKLKNKELISAEETLVFEVNSLFDGIALALSPDLYQELFAQHVKQNQAELVFPFISSAQIENTKNAVSKVLSVNYVFKTEELLSYFSKLAIILKAKNLSMPILIECNNHSVFIHYDHKQEIWRYIDSNFLEENRKENKEYYSELTTEQLIDAFFKSFHQPTDSNIAFNIAMFSNENEEHIKKNNYFKELYEDFPLTSESVVRYNPFGKGLLQMACEKQQVTLIKELLAFPELEINKKTSLGITPFNLLCSLNDTDGTKELLKHPEIDVNESGVNLSPLLHAIMHQNVELTQLLVNHPKIRINGDAVIIPLELAFLMGNISLVKLLLEHPQIDISKKIIDINPSKHLPYKFINLYLYLKKMEQYGDELLTQDDKLANSVIGLAKELTEKVDEFYNDRFKDEMTAQDFERFASEFKELLHSKDELMSTHRALWKPIVANILLALTGIGLLAIAIKTAVRYIENKSLTVNNCLFFSATKRQENISKVEQSINRIYDSEFCNDLPSVSSPLSAY